MSEHNTLRARRVLRWYNNSTWLIFYFRNAARSCYILQALWMLWNRKWNRLVQERTRELEAANAALRKSELIVGSLRQTSWLVWLVLDCFN
jgi:hypothetical protein